MIYGETRIEVLNCTETARLCAYVPDNSPEIEQNRRRPSVIVCPGGGYHFLSDREAEPVALRLCALGINAFVLYYSVAPSRFPVPQAQLAAAVRMVRGRASEWAVDPDKVFVAGFSAGGHLAASLGTMFMDPLLNHYGFKPGEIRPRGMILSYPVITSGEYAHRGSFDNLLGERYEQLMETVSLEKRVTVDTVPAFIWHTYDDASVPVENSLLLASALRGMHVPFELHVYPTGQHGLSLSNDQVYGPGSKDNIRLECAGWIDMAARWVFSF